MRRIDSLDGLRALAVLLVFVGHVDQHHLPGGYIGVEVFFIISGYLITNLLLREHARTGTISLRRFYLRRLLRLWPALLLFVVVVTPIAALDHIGKPVPDGLAALFYLTDFWANVEGHFSLLLHTWSLAVEEQFYLVWPALLIVALRRGLRGGSLAIGLAVAVLAGVLVTLGTTQLDLPLIQYLPNAHIAELVSGVALALALDGKLPSSALLRPAAGTVAALGGMAMLIVFEVLVPAKWWAWPLATLAAWPIVAHLVLHHDGWLARVFSSRPMVWLGRRSYGFYLWHYAVIELLLRSMPAWEAGVVGLGLTLAISAASFRYWEQPFLRIKERFAQVHVEETAPPRPPRAGLPASS
jgi:peptidoglycan/LPS O-acetylase OafA/YrhL